MSMDLLREVWDSALPHTPKSVMAIVAERANAQGEHFFYSQATICRMTSLGERCVRNTLHWLESIKLLVMTRPATQHSPAHYSIDLDELKKWARPAADAALMKQQGGTSCPSGVAQTGTGCRPSETADRHVVPSDRHVVPSDRHVVPLILEASLEASLEAVEPGRAARAAAPAALRDEGFASLGPQEEPPQENHAGVTPAPRQPQTHPRGETARARARAQEWDPPGFQAFYDKYPRHVGRADAVKEWQKIKPELHAAVMAGLERQLPELLTRDLKYVQHARKWLHGRHWEDEVPDRRSSGPTMSEKTRRNYTIAAEAAIAVMQRHQTGGASEDHGRAALL